MQFPSKFIAKIIEIESDTFGGLESESLGGRTIVSSVNGHRLSGYIQTPPLSVDDMRDISSWLDTLSGSSTVITLSLPLLSSLRGHTLVNPTVRVSAVAGSKQVHLENLAFNLIDAIKPDDLLVFSGHSKGYTVSLKMTGDLIDVSHWNSDGAGDLTIQLTKPLLNAVSLGEIVNVLTPKLTVRMSKKNWKRLLSPENGRRTVLKFPFKEHY
jgi:hypothetical protein